MSTILDALRKAQAEGGETPAAPDPEFPPPPSREPLPPEEPKPDDHHEKTPRSYGVIGIVVVGVSLGLILGRLLLPLATTAPDSSDLLADGIAQKSGERRAANVPVAPAENPTAADMRRKKREDAKEERQKERSQEAIAAGPPARPPARDSTSGTAEVDETAPTGEEVAALNPAAAGETPDALAAPATDGEVRVPVTLPRPESAPLDDVVAAVSPGDAPAAVAVERPRTPQVLGNVVPSPEAPIPGPDQLPPGLDELGRDPLTDTVAAVEPPADEPLPEPVTSPPPPALNAPAPRALPNAPADAPKVSLLFIQWSNNPAKRVVSLRQEGGAISIVREGDIVQGMRLAAIHPSGVEFQWRGQAFVVPVSRY